MTTDVATDVAGKCPHPCIDTVEVFYLRFEANVIDGLNNGLRTHICLIRRVSQDDDAGGVIAKGGHIGLDESLR